MVNSSYNWFPSGASSKEPACQGRKHKTHGSDTWVGKISPGGGQGNPLQYSWLENHMNRGAWWAIAHGSQRVGHDWSDLACTSVQFSTRSCLTVTHGLQHARLPCPSPTPRACSNSCPSNQWCHPTISSSVIPFSSCLQIFSSIRVFSKESVLCIKWPKYWSFSFNPSNEYSGLISFRIDWFDRLAVQGTCKSLLQHHGSRVSILQRSAFFIVHFSHPYMTTGKPELWLEGPLLVTKIMPLEHLLQGLHSTLQSAKRV